MIRKLLIAAGLAFVVSGSAFAAGKPAPTGTTVAQAEKKEEPAKPETKKAKKKKGEKKEGEKKEGEAAGGGETKK